MMMVAGVGLAATVHEALAAPDHSINLNSMCALQLFDCSSSPGTLLPEWTLPCFRCNQSHIPRTDHIFLQELSVTP